VPEPVHHQEAEMIAMMKVAKGATPLTWPTAAYSAP
jgi:hypothetical protein